MERLLAAAKVLSTAWLLSGLLLLGSLLPFALNGWLLTWQESRNHWLQEMSSPSTESSVQELLVVGAAVASTFEDRSYLMQVS